jgi:protein gp37
LRKGKEQMPSKIAWTNETWNPVTGCTKISPGCAHCYAERMARRLAGRYGYPEAPHHFDVTLHPDRLAQPLRWKKPRLVFVCSMGDLFHEDVPWNFIERIYGVMYEAKQHTFQVLTKRPRYMAEFTNHALLPSPRYMNCVDVPIIWRNVWLGVTAENQEYADKRIPELLQAPAAVRFVSVEPMLGPVDLSPYLHCGISWCIIGAESGPKHRPMNEDWARRLIAQCKQANVAVFYKQAYQNGKIVHLPKMDGKQYTEYPQTTGRQSAR